MTTDRIHAITFVLKCKACGKYSCFYLDENKQCKRCHRETRMAHISTLDPAIIVERFLNKDRKLRKEFARDEKEYGE